MLQHFLLLILCILYGMFFVLGKIALEYVAPIFFTGIRMFLAGSIMLGYCYHRGITVRACNLKQYWYIMLVAIFGIYLTNALEFWGLKYVSSAKSCLLSGFYPIVTAFLAWLVVKEKLTIKKILGLLIGTLAFGPVLIINTGSETSVASLGVFSYAEIALLISAVTTAIGWIFARIAIKTLEVPVLLLNALSMLLGGIMALGHSYITENWQPLPIYNYAEFFIWLSVVMIISNFICYNLHGLLLKKFTATYISFANLIDPLFASIFGWLFLQEVLHYQFWLSFIFVVIGLSIYYKESIKLQE